jgi:UPF0755 protein
MYETATPTAKMLLIPRRAYYWLTVLAALFLLSAVLLVGFLNTAPPSFTASRSLTIAEGMGISSIAELLEREGYIRSSLLFKLFVVLGYRDGSIAAGEYTFSTSYPSQGLVRTLMNNEASITLTPVTFPEGWSVHDIQRYTNDVFPLQDTAVYNVYEGTLFPETYFVAPHETLDELIGRMRDEYEKRISPYRERIIASGLTEQEVVIFASILEREANDVESMRRVAGVLHNRLREGLPLQVDATFEYLFGKTSAELTVHDLAIDSPMNTYTNSGLPPEPIANPGIVAIEAVLDPIPSTDFFYLTGDNGKFYYAATFEGHKTNKEQYLR